MNRRNWRELNNQPVAYRRKTNPELEKLFTEVAGEKPRVVVRDKDKAAKLFNRSTRMNSIARAVDAGRSVFGVGSGSGWYSEESIIKIAKRQLMYYEPTEVVKLIIVWNEEVKEWESLENYVEKKEKPSK